MSIWPTTLTPTIPTTAPAPTTNGTGTTSFASTLSSINGTLSILGGVGLSALQNKGIDLKGQYDTELAKISALRETNLAQYNLQLAQLNAKFQPEADALKAKSKRQLYTLIVVGVLALCALVGTMVYLFRRK